MLTLHDMLAPLPTADAGIMDYMKSKSAVTPGGEQLALARARLPGLRPEQRLQQAWSCAWSRGRLRN